MPKKIINKPEYYESFDILSDNDTEYTKFILLHYIEDIIKNLPNKYNLLDIGPGNGKLSDIYRYFNNIVAIEPNKEYFGRLRNSNISNLKIYNNFWEETELKEKFDLCLCSHILYYIPKEEWLSFIKKIDRHRKDDGKMVITLASAKGDTCKFPAEFSNEVHNFELFKRIMKENNYNYNEILFKSTITINKNAINKLCEFLLLPYENVYNDQTIKYFEKRKKRDFYYINNYTGLLIYPS